MASRDSWQLPEGWQVRPIGDVTVPTERHDPRTAPEDVFLYVDISSVSAGEITSAREVLGKDAPSRARKVIRTGDVIVATTRPYLRSIAHVPPELDGQICSTGFCVLRSNDLVNPRWLFFFALSDALINQLVPRMRGASYPAVTDRDVLECTIVVPPLPEQERMVARLDRIERALFAQQKSLSHTEALMQSALHRAFRGRL